MIKNFTFIFLFFCFFSFSQEEKITSLDSIFKLRKLSKNNNYSIDKRIDFAKKAIYLSKKNGSDSTVLNSNKALSFLYLNEKKHKLLATINFENLRLSKKLKDSASTAHANYILGYMHHVELKVDSAYYYYYNAVKVFSSLKDYKNAGEVFLNMADIQETERDYIGSEINAIAAKELINFLPESEDKFRTLWVINNLIGIVSEKLSRYDESLYYHNKANEIASKMDDGYYFKILTAINIGSTYREKKDYETAINKFSEIIENRGLLAFDSSSYAGVNSNLSYSKFLNGVRSKVEIENPYRESIKIAKDINDFTVEMSTYLYLAEYFESIYAKDSAKKYINKSYKIAKATNSNDVLLEALILKSSLSRDSSDSFFKAHTKLSDSLVFAERSIRNKFARIDYETNTIIEEKAAMSRQNIWLIITSIGLLFSILLLYIIKTQREKNKELQLEQQQQEANEEIYNLMLSQQEQMDEVKALEKKRISQELHDGILGRLFGARLSLDSLNYSDTEEAKNNRSNYIVELKEIEQDIRKVSHDLNADFITHAGFSEMINTLVVTQCRAYELDCETRISEKINWDTLSNKTKIHLYRIVQEALQNIYKHAKAKSVEVSLQQQNNLIHLKIKDNGIGFDSSKQKRGIGLKNIKSRVDAIGATKKIDTKINQGTIIIIELPI